MKTKKITLLLLSTIAIITLSSFVLASSHLQNRAQNYLIRHNSTLPSEFVTILPTVINQMNPRNHVSNAPNMIHGGIIFGSLSQEQNDATLLVNFGFNSNDGVLATAYRYVSGGIHTQFDIKVNSNFSGTFSDGTNGGGHDRATVLRHELGHGVGLGHSGVGSRLMGAYSSINTVKNIGTDEIRGYNCIYNNICIGQEGGSGNLEFSMNTDTNNVHKILKWGIETDNNTLIGFNVYKKLPDSNLKSVNSKMIKYNSDLHNYSFLVEKNSYDLFYLEIIGESNSNIRMLKFK
jgi:hypothetical protein